MGPETVVGICLSRGAPLIVALVAVLKAGGAYLPLDPAYPARRLADLIEGAGARAAITEDRFAGALPATGLSVVRVDGDAAAIAAESADRPASAVSQRATKILGRVRKFFALG